MEAAGTDAVGGGGFLGGALGRPDRYVGPDATGTRVAWRPCEDGAAPEGQGPCLGAAGLEGRCSRPLPTHMEELRPWSAGEKEGAHVPAAGSSSSRPTFS